MTTVHPFTPSEKEQIRLAIKEAGANGFLCQAAFFGLDGESSCPISIAATTLCAVDPNYHRFTGDAAVHGLAARTGLHPMKQVMRLADAFDASDGSAASALACFDAWCERYGL